MPRYEPIEFQFSEDIEEQLVDIALWDAHLGMSQNAVVSEKHTSGCVIMGQQKFVDQEENKGMDEVGFIMNKTFQ